jgi:hypothetical protein
MSTLFVPTLLSRVCPERLRSIPPDGGDMLIHRMLTHRRLLEIVFVSVALWLYRCCMGISVFSEILLSSIRAHHVAFSLRLVKLSNIFSVFKGGTDRAISDNFPNSMCICSRLVAERCMVDL